MECNAGAQGFSLLGVDREIGAARSAGLRPAHASAGNAVPRGPQVSWPARRAVAKLVQRGAQGFALLTRQPGLWCRADRRPPGLLDVPSRSWCNAERRA